MAKRRGNNEGTIYQRKDGLWRAQIGLKWKAPHQICQRTQ